ncbi:hypothetical protein ACHQM5_017501 [Ranunculus cassubicifolius]
MHDCLSFAFAEFENSNVQDNNLSKDSDFISNATQARSSRVLEFGHGSIAHGRDSRYWDRDDRRRDDEYNENESEISNNVGSAKNEHISRSGSKHHPLDSSSEKSNEKLDLNHRSVGLYNEAGRNELKHYEAEYEASLKNVGQSRQMHTNEKSHSVDLGSQKEGADIDDEYDDGIDSLDARVLEGDDVKLENDAKSYNEIGQSDDSEGSIGEVRNAESEESDEAAREWSSRTTEKVKLDSRHVSSITGRSTKRSSLEKKSNTKRKSRHHKYSGSSCQMKLLNSTALLIEPLESRKFSRFSLQYTEVEEKPIGEEQWEPRFAGHQSLQEREDSFHARDQKVNCGFIKGPKGSASTGFDLAEDDARFMGSCHIAVSSCIFGNSDNLRTPFIKVVTRLSRKNVCFVMFMDEITLQTISSEGQKPDRMGFIGLWKIVVVKNLPYADMRRVGKIPKFLTHRLFPSARYSIWLDSKLRLQSDPLLILEYFLWRKGYEYAISNHYDRHCLWEEVAQNKKLNKFNHTIIDQQFAFYQADGLQRFNASDPNKLLPSNVPEGSFIMRAHTPMSNLFSCLWFNEVDRFTPRDQLSFAYTHLKLRRMNPGKLFHLNMFKDCERRAIAKLFRHRSEDKRSHPLQATE